AGYAYYVNHRALPVAWLVDRQRVVTADRALRTVRGLVAGRDFDPTRVALVETPVPGIELEGADRLEPGPDPTLHDQGSVTLRTYRDDLIEAAIDARRDVLMVTSELAYPGWEATLDGRPVTVRTVNYAFRAVAVPAGQHTVALAYRPWAGRLGLAIS